MSNMDYTNHQFSDIKYKDGPDRDPKVTLKYEALSTETDEIKETKDKFHRTPSFDFREVWRGLIEFWKMNMEEILGDIDWNLEEVRMSRIKIKYQNDKPVAVQYYATVTAPFDEQETIPTPFVQPSMAEGEIEQVRSLCDEAVLYLKGKQDQQKMEFSDESEPESNDSSDEDFGDNTERADLSDVF
jgi:hypothetical protein